MKNQMAWASTLGLALTLTSLLQTQAITNGVIVITTRTAQDARYRIVSSSSLYDGDDYKGPGAFSPGDAAMGELLQDNGYATRLLPEWLLRPDGVDPISSDPFNPENYYNGGGGPTRPADTDSNVLFSAMLVIVSGSGSSADMPPPNTNGIPIIMGEHSCLGDRTLAGQSSLYLYSGISSANWSLANNPGLYMKVVAPNHPIMQGIPLDSLGRVKIFRDPYPEENAHLATGAKPNYEISWTTVDIVASTVGSGVTVIGLLDEPNTNRAVFAVADVGAQLAATNPYQGTDTALQRLVHFFVNEDGSGGVRRAFNALTPLGRVIFLRTCKWAMGEQLQPYQSLGIIDVTNVGPMKIRLSWQGATNQLYRILGTTDFASWQPVGDDIPGLAGPIARTLDISAAQKAVYMRVASLP